MKDRIQILYAEDDPSDAELTRRHFEQDAPDFDLEIVETASRCLKRIQEKQFDLLLLDQALPEMEGVDILRQVRQRGHVIPVVMVTGSGDENLVVQVLRAGANDYVPKQDSYLRELPQILRGLMREEEKRRRFSGAEEKLCRILYVETDLDDIQLTQHHFAELKPHFSVTIARCGSEALKLLRSDLRFDMVVSDLRMPEMNGIELLRKARHIGVRIPFIIVTGKSGEDAAVAAVQFGASDYIVKRGSYLTQLAYSIENAIQHFRLDQANSQLSQAIESMNRTLEERVQARTRELNEEIARREKVERALREAEEKYRSIVENSVEGIFQIARDGSFLMANPATARIFGYESPAELIEQRENLCVSSYVEPAQREEFRRRMDQDGEVRGFEYEVYRKDRARRWVRENARVVRNAQGEAAFYEGTIEDITERKLTEEKLRSSEASLARAQKITRLGSWELDLAPKAGQPRLAWSDEVHRIFGWEPGQIEPTSEFFYNAVHPEDRESVQASVAETLRTGKPGSLDHRIILPDGSERVVLERSELVRNAAGVPVKLAGTVQDITEAKRAERALRASEARFHSVWENSVDGMRLTDRAGVIVAVNRAFCQLVKMPREALEGKLFTVIFSPVEMDLKEMLAAYRQRFEERMIEPLAQQKAVFASGKAADLEVTSSFVQIPGQSSLLLGQFRNITRQIRLEEQLRQSQKMEAIGQLAGGIAHDFNNLLTVINGHATLLQECPELPARMADSAGQISFATERASNLTRQLLLFSRKKVIQARTVNLNEVVSNVVRMLQRILGEDIKISLQLASRPVAVFADTGMIEQVLMNLSVNARDAMPGGGSLYIFTDEISITDSAMLSAEPDARPGKFACLTVADTGTGISPEVRARMFEPFFTTKEAGKGTGLGLATVFGIVKQHQGWIDVSSQIGQGAAFKVFLPIHDGEEENASSPAAPGPEIQKGRETILLVEDERGVRELAHAVLKHYGYKVLSAISGVEALSVWKSRASEIDLLLTDMVMPGGVSGKDLAEKLLSDRPDLKVLYTTGYSVDAAPGSLRLEEGVNFLQKPYTPRKLAETVRNALDKLGSRS